MVERVYMSVQDLAQVWDPGCLPRVHTAVHGVEVRNAPMCEEETNQEVAYGIGGEMPLHREGPRGPLVTEEDLDASGEDASESRIEGIVLDLLHGRINGVQLVLVKFLIQWREIQEPVPETTNDPGRQKVSHQNGPHPVPVECGPWSKSWINLARESWQIIDTEPGKAQVPAHSGHGGKMSREVEEGLALIFWRFLL